MVSILILLGFAVSLLGRAAAGGFRRKCKIASKSSDLTPVGRETMPRLALPAVALPKAFITSPWDDGQFP